MHGQKKTALGITGLSLLFILLAAGCEQATSSDPESRGEGVLGQLYGVVVDSVTGQPLEGVEIALRDSSFKALTDAKGAYLIKDVPPGLDYVLTYTKAGEDGKLLYRFHTVD
ncbi:MAG: carboxypeptidase-like regulatory domain-containing protein, partial [Treponema sp.]|nr:carboxypeptidase-like regulatory domain-containing protein [Treponema sp.]